METIGNFRFGDVDYCFPAITPIAVSVTAAAIVIEDVLV